MMSSANGPEKEEDSGSSHSEQEHTLSPQEIKALKRAFLAFEINGLENVIHPKDLGNVLRSVGQNLSNLEILDMINELDEEGYRKITFDNFLKAIAPKLREITIQEEMKEAFRVFDKDGNGVVSMNEFRSVLCVAVPNISQRRLADMLHDMDVNHDGTIDYQEFVDLMAPVMDSTS